MTDVVRFVTRLLIPGGLIVAAAAALEFEPVVLAAAAPYANVACFGALAASALLSWYYDQARTLLSAIAIGLVIVAAGRSPEIVEPSLLAGMCLLPIGLVLLSIPREHGVLSRAGLLSVGLVAGGAYVATAAESLPAARLLDSGAVGVSFGLSLLVLTVLAFRRRVTIDQGIVPACAAMYLGLGQSNPHVLAVYGAAAGLAILFAVLEHGVEIAYRDDLTGLPSRRASRASLGRLGRTFTIALCDVDHFKAFNDRYGHETGNRALRMVAEKLAVVGGGGRAFRYGGEEFLIVFRGRTVAEVEPLVHAVREAIAATPLRPTRVESDAEPRVAHVSVSIGLAERTSNHQTPGLVIEAADAALYEAKAAGRDRVRVAEALRTAV